jgi:hypothetical protein
MALGVYPLIDSATAKFRHAKARQMLRDGIDPAGRREELRCMPAEAMKRLKERTAAWLCH